ncbi:hypothetical protein Tco_0673394 [Tanacetum coccineum]
MVTTRRNSEYDVLTVEITNDIRMVLDLQVVVVVMRDTPSRAEDWITHMEKLFQFEGCPETISQDSSLAKRFKIEGDATEFCESSIYDFRGHDQRFTGRNGNDRQGQDPNMKIFSVFGIRLMFFPDELPELPPARRLEFGIELIPGAKPISKAPYRMAPDTLKDDKEQQKSFPCHIVSADGVIKIPSKVDLSPNGPRPTYGYGIEKFSGSVAGYTDVLLRVFSRLALPSTQLIERVRSFWTDERQESFEELKRRLVSASILDFHQVTDCFHIYSECIEERIGLRYDATWKSIAYAFKAAEAYKQEKMLETLKDYRQLTSVTSGKANVVADALRTLKTCHLVLKPLENKRKAREKVKIETSREQVFVTAVGIPIGNGMRFPWISLLVYHTNYQKRHDAIGWLLIRNQVAILTHNSKNYGIFKLAEIFTGNLDCMVHNRLLLCPTEIPKFTFSFWKGLKESLGALRLSYSIAFHPQTDGPDQRGPFRLWKIFRGHMLEWNGLL